MSSSPIFCCLLSYNSFAAFISRRLNQQDGVDERGIAQNGVRWQAATRFALKPHSRTVFKTNIFLKLDNLSLAPDNVSP